jgi:hypothetical protein
MVTRLEAGGASKELHLGSNLGGLDEKAKGLPDSIISEGCQEKLVIKKFSPP